MKKNDVRLLRRIGDVSLNKFTKYGNNDDYTIEYESYGKITKNAMFDDGVYKNMNNVDRIIEPEPFINPHLKSSLIFEYDYTVEGEDYSQQSPPFKWEIEYDMKLSDFNPKEGYKFLFQTDNMGPLNHAAINVTANKKLEAPLFSSENSVIGNTVFDYNIVDKWFKFKYSYEQTNDQLIGVVDFLGIHDECVKAYSPYPLNGVQTVYIGGTDYRPVYATDYTYESMYFKNVKIRYNDKLILDCPDPSTGKNLVGADATPHNIFKR